VELVKASEIGLNALAAIERRRAGMTELAVRPNDRRTPLPPRSPSDEEGSIVIPLVAKSEHAPSVDPVVFPGERLSRVSDFVGIELAAVREGLDAVLAREQIAAAYYADAVLRFDRLMRRDPWLAQKRDLMKNPEVASNARAPAKAPASRPAPRPLSDAVAFADPDDPVVFPGERLARLSDFVRAAAAARKADFLGYLHREKLHPIYYAHMRKRFEAMCKADCGLAQSYREKLGS
jgi:hypothetical protein